jgi:hypothetical protein
METTVNGNDLVGKAVATAVSKFIQEGIAKDIKEGAPEHFLYHSSQSGYRAL